MQRNIERMLAMAKPLVDAKRKSEMAKRQGKFVSKNEKLCAQLLRVVAQRNYPELEIIESDINILPGWEVDISIKGPYAWKMVVEWDGAYHRKPIYGEAKLKMRQAQDRTKNKALYEGKYVLVRVKDDGSFNPEFVQSKVEKIKEIIDDLIESNVCAYGKIEI